MKTIKNFFSLATLIVLALTFFTTASYAQEKGGTADMNIGIGELQECTLSNLPARLPKNGEVLLATHNRTRTQLVAKVRGGKIMQIGAKSARGGFTPLRQTSSACSPAGPCYSWQIQKCFILPWGGCVCICGAWYTS